MKIWAVKFWKKHGDRVVFLSLAMSLAGAFMFFPDLKETGKTILIGGAMLLFNKARSPEREDNKEDPK